MLVRPDEEATSGDAVSSPAVEPNVSADGLGPMTQPACPAALDSDLPQFEVLYQDLWPGTVRLAHLLTGSQAIGEEIAQDAFLELLRRLPDIREPKAYLRQSVVNRSSSLHRRTACERDYTARLRDVSLPPPEVDETWQVLCSLPERQRAVLVLRYYEDLSEAEIARVLDCRPGTVKSTAARALASLKEKLA